ncbi:DUF6059 family protein [Streptomyces sp. NPDC096068]|uniref:DUF6059 family protein n=1 Tax=Streptomyces sp. NPDC096068 TaxID=3155424 RepID=UPI0033262D6C
MPPFALRCLRGLWESLVSFGHLWVHVPDPPLPTGPPPGHPERLCPHLPPTPGERALWDDLTGGSRHDTP